MFDMLGATFGATLAGCLVLVGTTGAAVYFFMRRQRNESEQFRQLQNIIYAEIRDVCEIALVRENFTSSVEIDDDKKIPLLNVHMPGTSRKFFMPYSGTIVCGFDLSKANILREGNKVKIFLPQSKILDAYTDVNSCKPQYQDTGIFAKIKLEEVNEKISADLEDHKQKSIQAGLLLRANENARQLLWSRILNRGLNRNFDIQITTSGKAPALNAP